MTRLHHTVFVGEPEVIVRTKTQDLAVFRKRNFWAHRTLNGLKVLPLAQVLDPLQKGLGSRFKVFVGGGRRHHKVLGVFSDSFLLWQCALHIPGMR